MYVFLTLHCRVMYRWHIQSVHQAEVKSLAREHTYLCGVFGLHSSLQSLTCSWSSSKVWAHNTCSSPYRLTGNYPLPTDLIKKVAALPPPSLTQVGHGRNWTLHLCVGGYVHSSLCLQESSLHSFYDWFPGIALSALTDSYTPVKQVFSKGNNGGYFDCLWCKRWRSLWKSDVWVYPNNIQAGLGSLQQINWGIQRLQLL